MGIAITEGIEPCSKQNILPYTRIHSLAQVLFRKSAPGNKERPQGNRELPFRLGRNALQFFGISLSEHRHRERIVENYGAVIKLMSGAAKGRPQRGPGWSCLIHKTPSQGQSRA